MGSSGIETNSDPVLEHVIQLSQSEFAGTSANVKAKVVTSAHIEQILLLSNCFRGTRRGPQAGIEDVTANCGGTGEDDEPTFRIPSPEGA